MGTGTVARRFPPAPSLPCIDIVWTARHACKPPRAATFFSTIAAAESLTCAGVSPPAAASETANASDIQTASDFRNIDATSFEDFRLRPELSIGSNSIRKTLIPHKSVTSKLPNDHIYASSAFHYRALVQE